jgi:phosphonoacetate hydrolase
MSDLDRLEDAVHDGRLAGIVDHLARPVDHDRYRVTGVGGTVTFGPGDAEDAEGTHPFGRQDPGHLATAAAQADAPHPDPDANAFPYARQNVLQLFDGLHAPDAVVLLHPRQRLDGNAGHHGTLGVVQARGPFVAAGPGIVARGMVDEHLRMIDVAPTLVALAGGDRLAVQDGRVRTELVDDQADHVLVFLLDGTNAAALWDAVEAGEAPVVAGLVERGTAYRHGVLASLPTATLANHTTALTGAHPGHSGVLHHTWYDRGSDVTPNLLDVPQMFDTCQHLAPGVDTVHEAVHRARPDAYTACTYEFVDRGADWSSFALLRDRVRLPWPTADVVAAASSEELLDHDDCAFMSQVDTASVAHANELFAGRQHPVPAFCWVNLSVTDVAGHAAGPHSGLARAAIRDSDGRIGEVLVAVERAGILDRTAVVVLADHGMQASADTEPGALEGHLPAERWRVVDHLFAYRR